MSLVPTPANSTSLAALKDRTKSLPPDTPLSFFSAGGLDLMQRAATLLANSTLVPSAYRSINTDKKTGQTIRNDSALSNCVLALNMAQRMGADPLMIMQNLYIVEGRPGWSSQFVISSINACGKFSPLRYQVEDLGEKEVEWKTTKWLESGNGKRYPKEETHRGTIQNMSCTAWAIEKATGERIDGPPVTMEMAVAEGWYSKNGSKWQTMPEIMLRYRAASFFGKLYAPELLMGLQTAEEVNDIAISMEQGENGAFEMSMVDLNQPHHVESVASESPKTETAVESKPETPANGKQAADRQRAARAASKARAKANENEQADLRMTDTASEPAKAESCDRECPKISPDGSTRFVGESECAKCESRPGCPAWPEAW